MNNYIDSEHKVFFQTYKRLPIVIDKAIGCWIYDKSGKSYLDFLGGIAVNALGHSHQKIIEAVCNQVTRFMHTSNYFYQDVQIELAEKVTNMTGFDRIFFSNSGTEAVEGAIKLVRRWGQSHNKNVMIGFSGGFHGRTYGALSLMDKPQYKDGMGPFLDNMMVIPYNDPVALENSVNDTTAAVILEFLQGEGGITSASPEFVAKIFELKEKHGFLVIADEIQAGVGRTGKFFCFEHYGVRPDIVTMAKGIGGGLPLGAILAREELAGVWEKGTHGTTYGGNAVACAAGLAVISELESSVMENVRITGEYMHSELQSLKNEFPELITEVRGRGLMQGLVLSFDALELVEALLQRCVIANAASGKVLRLVPPLIATKNEVDVLVSALRASLKEIR